MVPLLPGIQNLDKTQLALKSRLQRCEEETCRLWKKISSKVSLHPLGHFRLLSTARCLARIRNYTLSVSNQPEDCLVLLGLYLPRTVQLNPLKSGLYVLQKYRQFGVDSDFEGIRSVISRSIGPQISLSTLPGIELINTYKST